MAFKKGESGNPSGKRTERIWRDAIIAAARDSNSDGDLKLALKRLAGKLITAADSSDLIALKEVGNRIDGTAESNVNVEHSGTIAHDHEGIPATLGWLDEIRGTDKAGEITKPLPH